MHVNINMIFDFFVLCKGKDYKRGLKEVLEIIKDTNTDIYVRNLLSCNSIEI